MRWFAQFALAVAVLFTTVPTFAADDSEKKKTDEEEAPRQSDHDGIGTSPVPKKSKSEDGESSRSFSDSIDSRITFVFADDNIFAGSADYSPGADFGERSGINTFFDNYDTKDSGQESKTNFVLYKRFGAPNPRIETEAALVARFNFFTNEKSGRPDANFRDDGSFLQAAYRLGPLSDITNSKPGSGPRVYMLAFPFNADRMRLGYSFDITWGGSAIFPKNTTGAPGLKIGWQGNRAYAFAGAKTHRQMNEATNRLDSVYGGLAGFGIDFTKAVRWEVNGGFFQKGVFPPTNLAQPGSIDGSPIVAQGVSTQLTYAKGLPVETSVDLRLYRNDPRFPWRAFRPIKRADKVAFLVSGEMTYLTQNLRDPEVYGQTVLQGATAGDLNFRVQKGYWRFTTDVVYRDLAFILFNVPSFTPYDAFPSSAATRPEAFVALGADYYIERFRLNPGVIAGYQTPATYVGDVSALDQDIQGVHTVVVRRQGDFEILPPGQGAFDIMSLRGFTRWDISHGMSMIGELTYTLDKNQTRLETTSTGTVVRAFDKPNVINQLSLAFIMQARF